MARPAHRLSFALAGLLLVLAAAGAMWAWQQSTRPTDRPTVGLMTSLPIYWPEGADMVTMIDGSGELPWVRRTLEQNYKIMPLDALAADGGHGGEPPLAQLRRLLIVQPRGLSPQDNAALDAWVRGGGHLLFALDPMLTGQYAVPLGDPRHPVTVGLIPPVIGRWGLAMQYRELQPLTVQMVDYGAGTLPVALAGELIARDPPYGATPDDLAARGDCRVLGNGIAAQCRLGAGRVTIVADAALFELARPIGDAEQQMNDLVAFGLE